jgi:hypothetical protein
VSIHEHSSHPPVWFRQPVADMHENVTEDVLPLQGPHHGHGAGNGLPPDYECVE